MRHVVGASSSRRVRHVFVRSRGSRNRFRGRFFCVRTVRVRTRRVSISKSYLRVRPGFFLFFFLQGVAGHERFRRLRRSNTTEFSKRETKPNFHDMTHILSTCLCVLARLSSRKYEFRFVSLSARVVTLFVFSLSLALFCNLFLRN